MSCYFIISVFLEPGKDRADYDDYIKRVRPIVEEHGGRYVVRSERLASGPLHYDMVSGQGEHRPVFFLREIQKNHE